jgi:hypothetical protein
MYLLKNTNVPKPSTAQEISKIRTILIDYDQKLDRRSSFVQQRKKELES